MFEEITAWLLPLVNGMGCFLPFGVEFIQPRMSRLDHVMHHQLLRQQMADLGLAERHQVQPLGVYLSRMRLFLGLRRALRLWRRFRLHRHGIGIWHVRYRLMHSARRIERGRGLVTQRTLMGF